jgi:hypothetical protein
MKAAVKREMVAPFKFLSSVKPKNTYNNNPINRISIINALFIILPPLYLFV